MYEDHLPPGAVAESWIGRPDLILGTQMRNTAELCCATECLRCRSPWWFYWGSAVVISFRGSYRLFGTLARKCPVLLSGSVCTRIVAGSRTDDRHPPCSIQWGEWRDSEFDVVDLSIHVCRQPVQFCVRFSALAVCMQMIAAALKEVTTRPTDVHQGALHLGNRAEGSAAQLGPTSSPMPAAPFPPQWMPLSSLSVSAGEFLLLL